MRALTQLVGRIVVALRVGWMREDRGAGLVEYALLVGLIAIVCIAAVGFIGTESSSKFSTTYISSQLGG